MDGEFSYFMARRNPEAFELLRRHRPSFVLLYVIAYRAQRTSAFNRFNLKPGEALLGDWRACGLTRQEYRTAQHILREGHFATFKATSKGTVATLTNSTIFDINAEGTNQQNNQRLTIGQPSANHQLTTSNNDNNEKNAEKGGEAPLVAGAELRNLTPYQLSNDIERNEKQLKQERESTKPDREMIEALKDGREALRAEVKRRARGTKAGTADNAAKPQVPTTRQQDSPGVPMAAVIAECRKAIDGNTHNA
jgi:hypothetical protein